MLLVLGVGLVGLVAPRVRAEGASDPGATGEVATPIPTPSAAVGPTGEPLLERAIDGIGYVLGPGDVLALTLQGAMSRTQELVVSPEGKVLIPGASEVKVAGKSLDEARSAIRAEVGRAYRDVQISVSLVRLRRFTVYVLGQVQNPGQYTASPVDRVSESIRLAGGLIDRVPLPGSKTPPRAEERGSERSIEVVHQDGSRARCDLLRFRRTGELAANPTVRDGDVILVDYRQPGVLLSGEVNSPGEIEFVEGDDLGDLIELAGGLTAKALLDTIEVARFDPQSVTPRYIYLSPATDPQALSFAVAPRDGILIRTDPSFDVRHTVRLEGEVVFPGVYVVDERKTSLRALIERAGGFTQDASLREAKLTRRVDESIKDAEFERLRLVSPADMSPTEYEYFKMRSRQRAGLMAVDFEALFTRSDLSQDVVLRNGDVVSVPPRKAFVTVSGQIAFPGNLAFEPELSVDDYIERAGGYAWKAAKGRTVVIRASSGEWIPKGSAKRLGPGDTIWVPEKPERDWYALFKDSLLIVSQLATVYLVIRSSTQ
ncbi:MAG: SLBB domain-containing protein [Candidatus Eisenbacteria bacterium]|nr:SLBB domain-containing protein [Candidatus Eisenbacteria bacterium]